MLCDNMGCDLVVYKEVEDVGCSMSYSTFNKLRKIIVLQYLKMNDIYVLTDNLLSELMCIPSAEFHKKVNELLETINTDESVAMTVLWNHSDCDGAYYGEDCENIANVIKRVIENMEENDLDKEWLETLYSTFKYVGDIDGILQVW